MAAVELGGRPLLAAGHADATLRLWDLQRQVCLLQAPLRPGGGSADEGGAAPAHIAFAPPPADEPGRPGKLVVQLDEPEQEGGTSRFTAFDLYGSAGPGTSLTGLDMQQVGLSSCASMLSSSCTE